MKKFTTQTAGDKIIRVMMVEHDASKVADLLEAAGHKVQQVTIYKQLGISTIDIEVTKENEKNDVQHFMDALTI